MEENQLEEKIQENKGEWDTWEGRIWPSSHMQSFTSVFPAVAVERASTELKNGVIICRYMQAVIQPGKAVLCMYFIWEF